MKKASKILSEKFYKGLQKSDPKKGKYSHRVWGRLHEFKGDVIKVIAEFVLAPKLQTGLLWSAENSELGRCLEQLVIDHIDEFREYPNIEAVARLKLGFIKSLIKKK